MARARSPDRDKAFEIFKEHNGDITNRKIAELLSDSKKTVSEKTVGGWKSKDEWVDRLNGVLHTDERSTPNDNTEYSKRKGGAPKGNKNAVNNKGGAPKGSRNATGNKGGAAPNRNSNAVTHGLFRKYLPQEVYELKEELEEAVNNDHVAILWQNIMLHYSNIIYSQKIMFVKDKDDLTKELKKQKLSENGMEEEWELQFAWDKQANLLTAQSRALSTLSALIRQFDELANKDDERRLKLEQMKLGIKKAEAEVEKITNDDDDKPIEIVIKRKGERS